MATISMEMAERLIKGDGWLPEHPDHDAPDNTRCVRLVEFTNAWGNQACGAVFAGEHASAYRYEDESEYVKNPRVIWTAEEGDLRHA